MLRMIRTLTFLPLSCSALGIPDVAESLLSKFQGGGSQQTLANQMQGGVAPNTTGVDPNLQQGLQQQGLGQQSAGSGGFLSGLMKDANGNGQYNGT